MSKLGRRLMTPSWQCLHDKNRNKSQLLLLSRLSASVLSDTCKCSIHWKRLAGSCQLPVTWYLRVLLQPGSPAPCRNQGGASDHHKTMRLALLRGASVCSCFDPYGKAVSRHQGIHYTSNLKDKLQSEARKHLFLRKLGWQEKITTSCRGRLPVC